MFILGQVLSIRLREEHARGQGRRLRRRRERLRSRARRTRSAAFAIQFGCDPERVDELIKAAFDEIDAARRRAPAMRRRRRYLDKVKETFTRDARDRAAARTSSGSAGSTTRTATATIRRSSSIPTPMLARMTAGQRQGRGEALPRHEAVLPGGDAAREVARTERERHSCASRRVRTYATARLPSHRAPAQYNAACASRVSSPSQDARALRRRSRRRRPRPISSRSNPRQSQIRRSTSRRYARASPRRSSRRSTARSPRSSSSRATPCAPASRSCRSIRGASPPRSARRAPPAPRARPRSGSRRPSSRARQKLVATGAVTGEELDRARETAETARADRRCARRARSRAIRSSCATTQIVAPSAGVVGDIPVRVGDRVTPADRAHHGHRQHTCSRRTSRSRSIARATSSPGSTSHRSRRRRTTGAIGSRQRAGSCRRRSTRDTQSVLVKADIDNADGHAARRSDRARARRVERCIPGCRVPALAVTRHRRPGVRVRRRAGRARRRSHGSARSSSAPLIDNDVRRDSRALARRPRRDIATPEAARRRGDRPHRPGKGQRLMFVDFFIRRPIFATVCAILIVLGGAIAIPSLPVARYPTLAAPQVVVTAVYIGASSRGRRGGGHDAARGGDQRRRGHALHPVVEHERRPVDDHRDVRAVARPRSRGGRRPEPRPAGAAAPARRGARDRRHGHEELDVDRARDRVLRPTTARTRRRSSRNYVDRYVRDELLRVPGVAEARIFSPRTYAMRLWLDPARLAARGLTAERRRRARCASRTSRSPPVSSASAPAPPGQALQISVRAEGRLPDAAAFERMIVKTGADGTLVQLKDVGRVELGAEDYGVALRFDGQRRDRPRRLPAARRQRARRRCGVSRRAAPARDAASRPGLHYADRRSIRPSRCARRSTRC